MCQQRWNVKKPNTIYNSPRRKIGDNLCDFGLGKNFLT